jgi:hypothetical protein
MRIANVSTNHFMKSCSTGFFKAFHLALVLSFTFAQVSVQAQSMQLALDDPEWSRFSGHAVEGRTGILIKQKLSFADYHTSVVKRSWTSGSSATSGLSYGLSTDQDYRRLITSEHIRKKQTLFFELKDSTGRQADVYCVSKFKGKDFYVGNNPVSLVNILGDIAGVGDESSSFYFVQIFTPGTKEAWHLVLDMEAAQRSPKDYTVRLAKNSEQYYLITPHSKVKSKKGKIGNMPFGSAGFQIRNKSGEPVAAVSMIDKGVVYLTDDLSGEERLLLSSACAALLLQEVLE